MDRLKRTSAVRLQAFVRTRTTGCSLGVKDRQKDHRGAVESHQVPQIIRLFDACRAGRTVQHSETNTAVHPVTEPMTSSDALARQSGICCRRTAPHEQDDRND